MAGCRDDAPALYGKPYISAAKDTWHLFKDRGIDALINDSLVEMSECHETQLLWLDAKLMSYR